MTAQKLWAFDAPTGTVSRDSMVVGLPGEVTIPTGLYLIQHEKGLVLFDTGLAFDAFDDAEAVYGAAATHLGMKLSPEQRIDRQLARIGLEMSDITHVIVSHGHIDHTGCIRQFPQAKFYIGPGEFDFIRSVTGMLAQAVRHEDFVGTDDFDWTEVGVDGLDLFGDSAIRLVHAPGHTPGQLVLLVTLAESAFLLTSDAAHLRIGLEQEIPDLYSWDDAQSVASLRKIKALAARESAEIWVHHDPDDYARHRILPDFYV